MLKIGEFSKLSPLTVKALRFYEKEGILLPASTDKWTGYRYYSIEQMQRLNTIRHLQRLGFTLDEIITLASIIQEESFTHDSLKNVASVLHNRLASPSFSKLQCDVTIHYINDYVTNSQYLTGNTDVFASAYNTYKCEGLPAGPITNPGLAAIEAALYPADTDYYYFVTDSEWNYYYASTYAQHKVNCNKVGLVG